MCVGVDDGIGVCDGGALVLVLKVDGGAFVGLGAVFHISVGIVVAR